MNPVSPMTRRGFLGAAAGASLSTLLPVSAQAQKSGKRFSFIGFSKPFQSLSFQDTADVVAEIGWDGIECPVRPKGQIEPERAADELPKLVGALRKNGLDLTLMTTRISRADEPHTETLLKTASGLGIKKYRMNYWKYDRKRPVMDQLNEYKAYLKDLADMNRHYGIQGCYQNHSGKGYIGAAVWDIHYMIKDLDPKAMGVCFDIGHATVEGGYAWETHAQLMEPRYGVVYLKDFKWEKTDKGWKSVWCPVGEGMVNKVYFDRLRKSSYQGAISQHHEYPVGEGKEMIRQMQKDLKALKGWLA